MCAFIFIFVLSNQTTHCFFRFFQGNFMQSKSQCLEGTSVANGLNFPPEILPTTFCLARVL